MYNFVLFVQIDTSTEDEGEGWCAVIITGRPKAVLFCCVIARPVNVA